MAERTLSTGATRTISTGQIRTTSEAVVVLLPPSLSPGGGGSGSDYKLRVKNAAGVLQAELTDFHYLVYSKQVNTPGLLVFRVNGEHSLVDVIEDKWQIEVWRRNKDLEIGWYCDFYGLYRQPDRQGAAPGTFTAYCPGQLSMLGWRIVAWKAGQPGRSEFVSEPAESIMKTLVSYNATAAATEAAGRIREGAITGVTVEADGGGGNVLDWYCAYANLLETMQKLARIAGGDFELATTGAAAWEFRWHDGQLGQDRTAEVIFSIERGNMQNPRFQQGRLSERTVAIVGGQGDGAAREVAIRTGDNYSLANDIEVFVDGRNINTPAGLRDKGDEKLDEMRAVDEFTFDVLQTASALYGLHYGLGDLVTVRNPFTGLDATQKVAAVSVSLSQDGAESITVETEDFVA